jgi:hypothetical protein
MNPMLREQTAGYAFGVDPQVSAAGTPITIQVPVDARSVSPNCSSVKGGARRRRRTVAKRRRSSSRRRRGTSRRGSSRGRK